MLPQPISCANSSKPGCDATFTQVSHSLGFDECSANQWAFGPICNVISDVVLLPTPVYHRGALSVWALLPEALTEVRKQVIAPLSTGQPPLGDPAHVRCVTTSLVVAPHHSFCRSR